jgi:PleD family two-component response regulator
LAILDIMMPAMSGLEVLQRIRKDDRFKSLKAILCSALRDRETISQGASLGVEYYILKPFKPDLVLQQVERALQSVAAAPPVTLGSNPSGFPNPAADDLTLLRNINTLADEIARGLTIVRSTLTGSPLANGSATFHNEDHRRALTPHFENMRRLLQQMENETLQIRRKAPETTTAALAM